MSLFETLSKENEQLNLFLSQPLIEYLKTQNKKEIKKFSTDSEFIQLSEFIFILNAQKYFFKKQFLQEYLKNVTNETQYLKNSDKILDSISKTKKILKENIKQRIEETKKQEHLLPRILRLSQKFQLSEKETEGFLFILISQTGILLPLYDASSEASSMGTHSEMTSEELLNFLSPNRQHIKQCIVEIDSTYRDTFSSSIVKLPKEVLHALVGGQLTASEFLKIDKTFLSDILMEEPNFYIQGISDDKEIEYDNIKKQDDENLENELELLTKNEFSDEKSFDLYSFIKKEQKLENSTLTIESQINDDDSILTAYTTDVEYLDDLFKYFTTKIKLRNHEMEAKNDDPDFKGTRDRNPESVIRELRGKQRMLSGKCEKRLKLTLEKKEFLPRLEKLSEMRKLNQFEKYILVLLIGGIISHDMRQAAFSFSLRRASKQDFDVGYILWILCDELQDRINQRKIFYKNSNLIRDGFIKLSEMLNGDLMDSSVDIDRRMLDYIVGLDCEFSEIVEGSKLYYPKVKLENVILSDEYKNLILSTVSNYEVFKSYRKKFGFDDLLSYGKGVVLLFHGESGTGKTMLANALANEMGKKILLINFGHIGDSTGQILKFIFREAKINDALLFFDECEVFFESRNKLGSEVNALLTEVERHDGLIIMATNRVFDIDQAMHRRITLAIEFKSPDSILRKKIWLKHIPKEMTINKEIDFEKLAINFELTGGLIKNSVLSALNIAVSRNPKNPEILEEDLIKGAELQLKGQLELNEFDKKIIPKNSISDLIISKKLKLIFEDLILFEKARKILLSQWGFEDNNNSRKGTTILLYGPSGTGKSLASEVIGYECGCPLKVINLFEIITQYTYNTTKNIQNLFQETKKVGAILVIEVQQENYKIDDSINILLHHIEHFSGIVILNISGDKVIVEPNVKQKFKFVLEFKKPDLNLRKELWKKMIPKKTPISDDVDFSILSEFELTGGKIHDVIFRAASKAALEKNGKLSMNLLVESAKKEIELIKQSAQSDMYY